MASTMDRLNTVEKDLQPVYAVWCSKLRKFVVFVENTCTKRIEQYIYMSDTYAFKQIHRPDIEYNQFRGRDESAAFFTVKATDTNGVTIIMRDLKTKSFRKEQFCMKKKHFVTLPAAPVQTIQAAASFITCSAQQKMVDTIIEHNLRNTILEDILSTKPVVRGDIHDQKYFNMGNATVTDYKSAVTHRQLTYFVKKYYLKWLNTLSTHGNNWVEEERKNIEKEVSKPPTMETEKVLLRLFFHMDTSFKKRTLEMLQTKLKVFWIDVEALNMPILNKMKAMLEEEGGSVDLKKVLNAGDEDALEKGLAEMNLKDDAEDSDSSDDSDSSEDSEDSDDSSPWEDEPDFEVI